jgi:hypothetical protein
MFITPTARFNRPGDTTAYTANDLVANSTTAGLVAPMRFGLDQVNGRGKIVAARLFTSSTVVLNANFNLYLFDVVPSLSGGDNAAFAPATVRDLLGVVALDLTSGASLSAADKIKRIALAVPMAFEATGAIFGLLQAAAGYAPANGELFETTLEIEG